MREIKVAHEYPQPPAKNWFERNQLLVMFILTTIGGGAISTAYQIVSHELVQKRELQESIRKEQREEQAADRVKQREIQAAKRKAVRDFLIDFQDAAEKRNYYAFRVTSHIKDIQGGNASGALRDYLKEDRTKYRNACEIWNLKRHFYERLLEFYVSVDLRRTFYDKEKSSGIVPQFINLHENIKLMIDSYDANILISPAVFLETKNQRETLSANLAGIYDELLKISMDSNLAIEPPGR